MDKWEQLYIDIDINNSLPFAINKKDVLYTDAGGMLVGGIKWAIITAPSGPGGSIAGFLVGGALEGIRASVAGLVSSWLLNWMNS